MQTAQRTIPSITHLPKLLRKMSSSTTTHGPSSNITEFNSVLKASKRVLALCGAGLSAASGLDTFRGAGGMWRNHKATALATPEAFDADPGLVWLFYSYRRHRALQARPNRGHYALVELAKKMPGFVTLTQNVDGLSQRANHPRDQLKLLHGSLFDIKCDSCSHVEQNNYDDPFHPSLAIESAEDARLEPSKNTTASLSDNKEQPTKPSAPATIDRATLPHCPSCKLGLLRPGVVWFGEPLPSDTLEEINEWIDVGKIDLIMVIGTTATVYPAAGYVEEARAWGARVAVVNMDEEDLGAASDLRSGDFLFVGDAAELLPEMVKIVVGEVKIPESI